MTDDESKGLVNGSTYHLRADVGVGGRAIDRVGSFKPSSCAMATCMLCDATCRFPVGGDWHFPWAYGRVWRLCPACGASDYGSRLEALTRARAASEAGAKKPRRVR